MIIYRMPEEVKGFVFDIDSTLYRNDEYVRDQTALQIKEFAQVQHMSVEQAENMVLSYKREWQKLHDNHAPSLGTVFYDLGIDIEQSIVWRKKVLNPEDYLKFDDTLVKSLKSLSQQYTLACLTNNPVSVAKKTLECIGVGGLISEIIGLDTLKISKPSRKLCELACQRVNTPLEHCVFVGDRYFVDLALPLEMGAGAIQVDTMEDIYNLPKILEYAGAKN